MYFLVAKQAFPRPLYLSLVQVVTSCKTIEVVLDHNRSLFDDYKEWNAFLIPLPPSPEFP